MQKQYIDIEEEKSSLWRKVYVDLANRITPSESIMLNVNKLGTIILSKESDGTLFITDHLGTQHIVEEYDDDILFCIYNVLIYGTEIL